MLLLVEVNLILEKQRCKRDAFEAYGISCIKIILAFLTEVGALYIQVPIVEFRFSALKRAIAGCGVYLQLIILLALDK